MLTRILIADPDESLANSYEEFLWRDGFDVATAINGLDCVAKLRTWTPDVLVLELDMPWGGGVGVLAMMHDGFEIPRVPVIVLTARRDFNGLGDLLPFEMMSDFHVKPLPPEQLARIIRRLLDAPPPDFGFCERSSDHRAAQGRVRHRLFDAAPILVDAVDSRDQRCTGA